MSTTGNGRKILSIFRKGLEHHRTNVREFLQYVDRQIEACGLGTLPRLIIEIDEDRCVKEVVSSGKVGDENFREISAP